MTSIPSSLSRWAVKTPMPSISVVDRFPASSRRLPTSSREKSASAPSASSANGKPPATKYRSSKPVEVAIPTLAMGSVSGVERYSTSAPRGANMRRTLATRNRRGAISRFSTREMIVKAA